MGTSSGGDKFFIVDSSTPILEVLHHVIIMVATYNIKFITIGVKPNGVPNIGLAHNQVLLLIQQTRDHCPIQMA
jgi:hypothetical protein